MLHSQAYKKQDGWMNGRKDGWMDRKTRENIVRTKTRSKRGP